MSRSDVKITIYGTKVAQTAKAVRFQIRAIGVIPIEPYQTEWFPLSQVSKILLDPSSVGADSMVVSEWIMKEKGLSERTVPKDPRTPPPFLDDEDDSYNDIPWEE